MNRAFDCFADWVADRAASAWFFMFCLLVVVVWLPSYFLFGTVDTWQLVINTTTTIITFLMVALLHNNQHRFEQATDDRLCELLRAIEGAHDPVSDDADEHQDHDDDQDH